MKSNFLLGGLLILPIILNSCIGNNNENDKALSPLESRGKAVYMSTCIACHNPDPRKIGSVGPDIAFSSLELVTLRVTKAQYPVGYKPKRDSKMMPAFPQLAADVGALHAYLNSFKK
jgi:mono/diheme cytochrome c family protein